MKYNCHCNGRCTTHAPRICCNICNADSDIFALHHVPSSPKKKHGKKQVKTKPYEMTDIDYDFRDDLNLWRDTKAVGKGLTDEFYGSQLVLPNGFRDRIVDLFHCNKLNSACDIRDQVKWNDASQYAEEYLTLYPSTNPYLLPSLPLHPRRLTSQCPHLQLSLWVLLPRHLFNGPHGKHTDVLSVGKQGFQLKAIPVCQSLLTFSFFNKRIFSSP